MNEETRIEFEGIINNVGRSMTILRFFCLFDLSYANYDRITPNEFRVQTSQEINNHRNDRDWLLTHDPIKLSYQIRARFPDNNVRDQLGDRIDDIQRHLNALRHNALINVDDALWNGNIRESIRNLLQRMRVKYLGPSNTTKILHRFAPEMIPILDNASICPSYDVAPLKPGDIEEALNLINDIRGDIRFYSQQLSTLCQRLNQPDLRIELSKLRIFDIILWGIYRRRNVGLPQD